MQAVCAYSPQVVIQSSFRVRELIDSRLIEQVLFENEIDWKELAFSKQVLSENEIDVWEWDWLNQPSQNRMRWEGGGGGGEIKIIIFI